MPSSRKLGRSARLNAARSSGPASAMVKNSATGRPLNLRAQLAPGG
jgi:hypothetical protein